MRQNLTAQGHWRRHVQQPLILRFRYPVPIFGPFPRGLKMSAALEAGFSVPDRAPLSCTSDGEGRAKRTETCVDNK
jgi:hypothetical protein